MKTVTSRTVPGKMALLVNDVCRIVPGKTSAGLTVGGSYFGQAASEVATATGLPASGWMEKAPQSSACA